MSSTRFVSYAQHGEDVILWRALGDRQEVRYVDVGAFDPTDDSVTRALYERGWRGINIEPQPDRLDAFLAERPEDINLAVAVSDHDGTVTLTLPPTPGWASTLPPDATGTDPASARSLEVPARRLDNLLAEHRFDHVDVLKIDVEGAEPSVVRGFVHGPVLPDVCVVEGVAPGVGRRAGDEAVGLLVEAGYLHCMFDGLNHYLTRDPALVDDLSAPANPMDGYVRHAITLLEEDRRRLHETIATLVGENLVLRSVGAHLPPQVPHGADDDEWGLPSTPPRPDSGTGPSGSVTTRSDPTRPDPEVGDLPVPTELGGASATATGPMPVAHAPHVAASVRLQRRKGLVVRLLRGAAARVTAQPQISPLARLIRLGGSPTHAPEESVAELYHIVLGREPETEGLTGWSQHIAAGMSLPAVARALAESDEARRRPAEERTEVTTALRAWEAFLMAAELGISIDPDVALGSLTGRSRDVVFVQALFDVAFERPPSAGELSHEVAKLASGTGREWMLRAYAAGPAVQERLGGGPGTGVRAFFRRWRDRRTVLPTFRAMVLTAEARRLAILAHQLLASDEVLAEALDELAQQEAGT